MKYLFFILFLLTGCSLITVNYTPKQDCPKKEIEDVIKDSEEL